LVERYGHIAATLQVLLQYIEVNITAVRKILKKFEKKVPAEFHVQNAQSYSAHHKLLTSDLQDLLVTVVQMHRLVQSDMKSFDAEPDVRSSMTLPISFVGPETLLVFQRIKVSNELRDLITGQSVMRIGDVYAKPGSDVRVGGKGPGGGNSKSNGPATALAATEGGQNQSRGTGMAQISQQVALNLGKADMYQGPPKTSVGQPSPSSGPAAKAASASAENWFKPGGVDEAANAGKAGRGGRGQGGQAAPKAGGRRGAGGKGNRGQRGSGGQPAQGQSTFADRGQRGAMRTDQSGRTPPAGFVPPNRKGPPGHDQGFAQGQQFGGTNSNRNDNGNMQCMFMMVPAGWGQSPAGMAGPPGSFKGSGNQASGGGKGGKGGGYGGMQVMGMVPNMDPNAMAGWGRMMPQAFNMGSMPDGGYPQGMSHSMGQGYAVSAE